MDSDRRPPTPTSRGMMAPRRRRVLVLVASLAAAPVAAQTAPPAAAAIVHEGAHGVPSCVSCHGPQLMGQDSVASPRIAGQDSAYVVTQLNAFVSGARNDAVMHPVASLLSPAERSALGGYLSRLPVSRGAPAMADSAPPSAATLRLGERLATRGRWPAELPACDQCHGPGGVGVGAAVPPLAGQPSIYLSNQLHAYRQGTRAPGPLSLMGTLARRMSEADIAAAAAYYAARPAAPPTIAGRRP